MEIILGYLALGGMGITLGLIGAGGSILTIPILVYLFGMPVLLATSYSLGIVAFSALIATIRYRRTILFRKALLFLIPSMLGVFCARHFIISHLPQAIGNFSLDKILVAMLTLLMAVAGFFMIRSTVEYADKQSQKKNIKIMSIGASLGIIMGLLGAGGGFLIIPTLIVFMHFTMKDAVPTSLFIVTTNSLIGFYADKYHFSSSDWLNLTKYLSCAFMGMFIGLYATRFIKGENLKKAFGYFIWGVGMAMIIKEFIF